MTASAPSPDPLPPPLPLPLNLTVSNNGQEMEDFFPVSKEEGELMGGQMKGFFRLRVISVAKKTSLLTGGAAQGLLSEVRQRQPRLYPHQR